jgi:putative ABC transport system permease protein
VKVTALNPPHLKETLGLHYYLYHCIASSQATTIIIMHNNIQHRWLLNDDELDLSPAKDIPPTGMAIASCPIIVVAIISLFLHLGNVQTLLTAATRCVGQLLLLGLILYPILRYNQPYVTVPYILLMILFATREASVKPKLRYRSMPFHMFGAMLATLSVSLTVINVGVLQPDPWYDAQVMVPVAGMMLGSCVNALSLGMDRFLVGMRGPGTQGSAHLQTFLACGATRWEASMAAVRQAIETGLTPNLNQMSVMGLVSIPGMLTGQLLAGTPPLVAAKYQIVIMFFLCSNSTMTLFLTLVQAIYWGLFLPDDKKKTYHYHHHTFRSDLIHQRTGGKPKDILLALLPKIIDLFQSLCLHPDETKEPPAGQVQPRSQQHSDVGTHGTFVPMNTLDGPPNNRASEQNLLLQLNNGTLLHRTSGRPLLSNLNLQVHEGDIILLSGPSGCGKSTLLRALALLEAVRMMMEEVS